MSDNEELDDEPEEFDMQITDLENDLTDYFHYTQTTNNKNLDDVSGISLLKELEDKWDHIEKKKSSNTKQAHKALNHNLINLRKKDKLNKLKQSIADIQEHFLDTLKKRNKDNNDFEDFALKTISLMQNHIDKNNKEVQQICQDFDIDLNQFHLESEGNITNTQQQQSQHEPNQDDNKNDDYYYDNEQPIKPPISNKTDYIYNNNYNNNNANINNDNNNAKYLSKKNKIRNKGFLLNSVELNNEEDYNNNMIGNSKIPLNVQANNFSINHKVSCDGLIYESPSHRSYSNIDYANVKKISMSLANKMKSVFDDITTPVIPPVTNNLILTNPNDYTTSQGISNISNIDKSNIKDYDNERVNKDNDNSNSKSPSHIFSRRKENLHRNNNPSNYSSNLSENDTLNNISSMYALERNFENILNKINPELNARMNQRIVVKNFDQTDYNKDNGQTDNDIYFDSVKKQVGLERDTPTKMGFNFAINKENLTDKKLSRKIEENVKLINDVLKEESIKVNKIDNEKYKRKGGNLLNNSYLRNNSISFASSMNNNSLFTDNKIYSKNRFDDSINKIYKANAFKINKLINPQDEQS